MGQHSTVLESSTTSKNFIVKDNKKLLIKLSNLFPLGTYPQLKQIQSPLNIADHIVPKHSRRWGSNPRTLKQSLFQRRNLLPISPRLGSHQEENVIIPFLMVFLLIPLYFYSSSYYVTVIHLLLFFPSLIVQIPKESSYLYSISSFQHHCWITPTLIVFLIMF